GTVKAASVDHAGRLVLVVRSADQEVRTFVRDAPRPDLNAYADRIVRVEGVLAASIDVRGRVTAVKVFAATLHDVTVLQSSVVEPETTSQHFPILTSVTQVRRLA